MDERVSGSDKNAYQEIGQKIAACIRANKARDGSALLRVILQTESIERIAKSIRLRLGDTMNDVRVHQLFGSIFRAALPTMNAVETVISPNSVDEQDFVYVVGTSNARGFGSSPHFFPIFAYIGRQTFALESHIYESCLKRTKDILKRLAPRKPLLLILGSEPRLLLENVFGYRPKAFGRLTETDFVYMDTAAARYKEFALDLQKEANGPLYFLVPMPTHTEDTNILTNRMIDSLVREMEGTDIGIINPYDRFIDRETGLLDKALQCSEEDGELHFNHQGLQHIISEFEELGLLPADSRNDPSYEWNNLISINMEGGHTVRIWCDPAKSMKSEMAAATMIGLSFLDYLTAELALAPSQGTIFLNSHQGYLPFSIPVGLSNRIFSVCGNEQDVWNSQRLFHFARRNEIEAMQFKDLVAVGESENAIDTVVLNITPNDEINELFRQLEIVLKRFPVDRIFTYGPEWVNAPELEALGYTKKFSGDFSNRHLRPGWESFTLNHFSKRSE